MTDNQNSTSASCSVCNAENLIRARFCLKCGSEFKKAPKLDFVCPTCGKDFPGSLKECPDCYSAKSPTSRVEPETGDFSKGVERDPLVKERRKGPKRVVLGIALSMILGAGSVILINNKNQLNEGYSIPKIEECYNISKKESESRSPLSAPIDCLNSHNSETYRVGVWPSDRNPYSMSDSELIKNIESVCYPFTIPTDAILNYWSFYIPTKQDWNNGARWIRCDAQFNLNDSDANPEFMSWKGREWVASMALPEGALLPKGESVFVYIEPNDGGCLGSGILREGTLVSLLEKDITREPATQQSLATSTLYSREGGCGLGALFELKTSKHSKTGLIYNQVTQQIIGTIDLTIGGNVTIYTSSN